MNSKLKLPALLGCIYLSMLFFNPTSASAQPYVDLLNVRMQMFAPTSYTEETATKLSGYQSEATFLIPMEQENKNVILVGGDYTKLHFQSTGETNSTADLYSVSMLLGGEIGIKKSKWRTTLLVLPKVNSDFKDISMDDFQMGGLVMFKYKKNDNLKYHFSLYYNREFFGNYFLPLVGIEWKINNRINLFGDLPNNLNLEYKISKSFYAGAAWFTTISSYRLSNSTGGMYVREGDKTMGHDELKIYVNAYLTKHLVAFLEGGETFYRTFTLYNNSNELKDTPGIFRKSKDGAFVNMGIAYRFRLD